MADKIKVSSAFAEGKENEAVIISIEEGSGISERLRVKRVTGDVLFVSEVLTPTKISLLPKTGTKVAAGIPGEEMTILIGIP